MRLDFNILVMLWLLPAVLQAQSLCEGLAGASAVQEDFGRGPNFGDPLPPGITTYNYTTNPTGGSYLVTNTSGLNGALWHSGEDHTEGDVDGYMLLFDATDEPGIFYERQISGLCPGTRYEFRAWVANVVAPMACSGGSIEPDLRFELRDPVSGNLLGSVDTGAIPTSEFLLWQAYGLSFVLPDGIDAIRLLLINNAQGGCGNDLAIDDISLRICNPVREQSMQLCEGDSVEVNGKWYKEPGIYLDTIPGASACNDSILITKLEGGSAVIQRIDTTLCEGDSFEFGGRQLTEEGEYRDTLLTSLGCDSIVDLKLSFASFFAALYVLEDTIAMGASTQFAASASGIGNILWQWSPSEALSCTDCPEPFASPIQTTTYGLEVLDESTGCSATFSSTITVLPCRRYYFPNAFSPNGDGQNDVFRLFAGGCIEEVLFLEVYDRWGGLVFAGEGLSAAWDGNFKGKPCPQGLYVFQAALRALDGSTVNAVGEVHLVR